MVIKVVQHFQGTRAIRSSDDLHPSSFPSQGHRESHAWLTLRICVRPMAGVQWLLPFSEHFCNVAVSGEYMTSKERWGPDTKRNTMTSPRGQPRTGLLGPDWTGLRYRTRFYRGYLGGRFYEPHFANDNTRAQRGSATRPRPHSQEGAGSDPRLPDSGAHACKHSTEPGRNPCWMISALLLSSPTSLSLDGRSHFPAGPEAAIGCYELLG